MTANTGCCCWAVVDCFKKKKKKKKSSSWTTTGPLNVKRRFFKFLYLIEGYFVYSIDFCHTSIWISHRCAYAPSLLSLPPTSHPSPPLQVVTEPQLEFPESSSKFPLAIWHMVVGMFPCHSLHSSHPLLLPPAHVHKSVLCVCISIAALKIGISTIFLESMYMH